MLRAHGRFDYAPIIGRRSFVWPQGRRLAVYVALNLEHYAFGEGLTENLVPGMPAHDVLNHAWRDYGNRVGAWRLRDVFDRLAICRRPCSSTRSSTRTRRRSSRPFASAATRSPRMAARTRTARPASRRRTSAR